MGVVTYSAPHTIRVPAQTTCNCSHRLVRPIQTRQRLVQRQSAVFSLQSSFSLSRRRNSRTSSQVVARAAQEDAVEIPGGYIRDIELAKFEAFLNREQCKDIKALVRGRQQLSYPIKGHWAGIYVLYSYAAKRSTTPKVQKLLSKSTGGGGTNVLRHMTFSG